MKCINCGKEGPHYVPPSCGEPGFYTCQPKDTKTAIYISLHLPKWAQFHEEDYQDPPEDWWLLEPDSELCECNDDPRDLAAQVAAHRYEIVALRKYADRLHQRVVQVENSNQALRDIANDLRDEIEGMYEDMAGVDNER